jgi:ferritin
MLSGRMQMALNGQINAELWSAYLYYSMAAFYEYMNLHGFAHWMKRQFAEELTHADKMFDYVCSSGGRVILKKIQDVPTEWSDALAPFAHALEHEKKVTGLIMDLLSTAGGEGDEATGDFLQWYVKEQDEEEENASGAVEKIKATGFDANKLAALDEELGQRK